MAFYLKYRPQTLDNLLGQELVKETLSSAFTLNKLSHAYLFVGPRGTGKTSTARILAKMVNCLVTGPVPCNSCSSCLSITDGSNLDLIEIDAASNNSVEDIRSLRDKVKLAPTSSTKKVYIIDEVHMLSNSAFNALLKTLEEPPAHALFILATTEVQKIPATILSRVQRLDFRLASNEDIKLGLKNIAKEEKLEIEDEALIRIAKLADGSFRDSVKLLEQLASLGKRITLQDTNKVLLPANLDNTISLLSLLANKKSKESILFINKGFEVGNFKELTNLILETLRQLMLIKNDLGEELVKDDLSQQKYQELIKLSAEFKDDDLVKSLDCFQKALEKFKYASIQVLPLEVAVIEICTNVILRPKAEESLTNFDSEQAGPAGLQPHPTSSLSLRSLDGAPRSPSPTSTQKTDTQIPTSDDINKLLEKWNFVLETVKPFNFSLSALLGSVKIVGVDAGVVTLEVPYSFHQRILEAPKSKELLQSVLSDVLEKSVVISVLLGERPMRVEDIANVEIAADDEIVRMASEIFNGKLVE